MSAIGSSYSKCPIEVREAIADQLCPKANASKEELQKCAQDLAALSAADKLISPYCQQRLEKIKQLYDVYSIFPKWQTAQNLRECAQVLNWLSQKEAFASICLQRIEKINQAIEHISKYRAGNQVYECASTIEESHSCSLIGGPPQLVVIFTALLDKEYCLGLWGGSLLYTPTIEEDIVRIIDVLPETLHCTTGGSSKYTSYTPLALACVGYLDKKLPLYIVEYLLTQGANPNDTLKDRINDKISNIFSAISQSKRYSLTEINTITALLSKYGGKPFGGQNFKSFFC